MQDSLRRFKADTFQALAHPTRIAILELLSGGELSAGALIEKLRMEQANVSQHLAVLRAKQLVSHRKAGNQVFYSLCVNVCHRVCLVRWNQFLTVHRHSPIDLES